MAIVGIRIGSIVNALQYDDTEFDSSFESSTPIKAGPPVAADDVLRLSDISISYPVGAVFLSVVSTNPFTLLGFGTWVRIAEGQMLAGYKSGDANFGTAEGTGGNKTVSHDHNHEGTAVANHDAHSHTLTVDEAETEFTQGNEAGYDVDNANLSAHTVTQPTGHSDHSILNPYFTLYVWKRTA